MPYVLVDPDSRLNWSHDWTDWLAEGDEIASRQWSIEPLDSASPALPVLSAATTDTVFVEGLLAGNVYRLTERVTTEAGLTDDRTIVLRADHR